MASVTLTHDQFKLLCSRSQEYETNKHEFSTPYILTFSDTTKYKASCMEAVVSCLSGQRSNNDFHSMHFRQLMHVYIDIRAPLMLEYLLADRLDITTAPYMLADLIICEGPSSAVKHISGFLSELIDDIKPLLNQAGYQSDNGLNVRNFSRLVARKIKENCDVYTEWI
jgi:hypothetical protein